MEEEKMNAEIAKDPEGSPASGSASSASSAVKKVDGATVCADFNAINAVLHYARAAHFVGLWKSELALIAKYFPEKSARLLEAGCGAGRVTVGLWHQGYRDLTGFDFAAELIDQARNLAQEQGIAGLTFLQADATRLDDPCLLSKGAFDGVLFLFNGLMQIPGRESRRTAMWGLREFCRPGGHFIFTTHDRGDPKDLKEWEKEAARWARGEQNPRLVEFGDRYFTDDNGNTYMHLPDREEVLTDLTATGWTYLESATRNELASETPKVRNFSDNCTFWVARR
jgi:SAM-dependent methyltransferase